MRLNSNIQPNIKFTGGITHNIKRDIYSTNPHRVQYLLSQREINADFRNNRVIAWCCAKTIEILDKLKKPLFGLPTNIFVKDLNELNWEDQEIYGFTNFLPCRITKNSDEVIPAASIIFNQDFPWDKLDEISDFEYYDAHNTATDYFLEPFVHEFGHIAHEIHLIDKFGAKKTVSKLVELTDENTIQKYKTKFSEKEDGLCECAKISPLELIACDISKRIITNLDKCNVLLSKNPFIDSPYQCFFAIINLIKQYSLQDMLINKFFNGKTKFLDKV